MTALLTGLLSCCSSIPTASLGAGAIAGKDYVTNLRPSAAARQYFTSMAPNAPTEIVTRGGSSARSGVRYVANDGILIPPGVTISFTNKGYCMDPHLPAPKTGDEYQLVPTSSLIPSSLQYTYQNLVRKAAADTNVRSNMQGLVWALRTAGTENSHASRLSASQKRILDSCSARPGDFERAHQGGLLTNRLVREAWKLADNSLKVRVGDHTWKASDFSSPAAFNSAVDSQLNSLIALGNKLPVQHTGFNYGELEPGIYTDIRGDGYLSFAAKIANNSGKDFIFYPCNYVAQVGNGSALSSVAFSGAASGGKKQRVTELPLNQVSATGTPKAEAAPQNSNGATSFADLPCAEKKKYYDMARMAQLAYYDKDDLMKGLLPALQKDGYKLMDSNPGEKGLNYAVLEGKDGVNYIAFRGTDFWSGDVFDDAGIAVGQNSGKMAIAELMVRNLLKNNPNKKYVLVGHSYGGSMVQNVINNINSSQLEGFVFNSYSLPDKPNREAEKKVTNIYYETDAVHALFSSRRINPNKTIVVKDDNMFKNMALYGGAGMAIKSVSEYHSIVTLCEKMREQLCPGR